MWCWCAAALHIKAIYGLRGFVNWDYSNPEWRFIGDITRNDNSIPSVATGWPLSPVTLVSLSLSSCLSGRGPSGHGKAAENRAVAVCICFNQNKSRPAAGGGGTLIASPAPRPPRRAGSGTRSRARGQPLPPRSLQWSLICRLLLAV